MMLIRTYLDRSAIHGIGIFAADFIPKGTKVWEFTPDIDRVITDAQLLSLPPVQREWVFIHSYRDPAEGQLFLLADNASHFNYSVQPNTIGADPTSSYAACDISAGEELTFPVAEDADAKLKLTPEVYAALSNTQR